MALNGRSTLHSYSAFGFTLCSSEKFSPWLEETQHIPTDLIIRKIDRPPFAFSIKYHLFDNPKRLSDGQPISQIYRADDAWGMRLAKIGDFYLYAREILFVPQKPDFFPTLQAAVLSNILAFWVELRGLRTLHGAALNWQERSFALLADSTAGKSTLAAGLLQNGASLISDDITVVETNGTGFQLRPGFPSMRLGFEQVEYFLGQQVGLVTNMPELNKAIVPLGTKGWARFEKNSQPPARFYILKRMLSDQPTTTEILPLKPAEAVMALVRYSFVHHIPFLTGTAAQRLDFLHHLASQVPVKRLTYPSGYEHLQSVCNAIQRDLAV